MIGCILVPLYMKKKTWTVQIKHVQAYKESVTDIMCTISASTQLVQDVHVQQSVYLFHSA